MSSFYGNVDQLFIIVRHFETVDDMNKDLEDKISKLVDNVIVTNTIMRTIEDKESLAKICLEK